MASFFGTSGRDVFVGGDNVADLFTFTPETLTWDDVVEGGGGSVTDELRFSAAGVISAAALSRARGIELIRLTTGSNWLTLPDVVVQSAYGAKLKVIGVSGADWIDASAISSAGQVVVTSGGGRDYFISGAGKDTYDGGSGADTIDYAHRTANVSVALDGANIVRVSVGGVVEDSIVNVENVTGGSGRDTLVGDALANALRGEAGNDRITGGLGKDTLSGGLGADRFVYLTTQDSPQGSSSRDVITDWDSADVLDLHSVDANTLLSGNQDFAFLGYGSKVMAGELRYYRVESSASTFVIAGTDNDGIADMQIELTGLHTLDAFDFSGLRTRVYDTTKFGSVDPSGLVYVPTRSSLFLVDSDVEEKPFFSSTNMFELALDGSFKGDYALTRVTNEPTGLAYWRDPETGKEYLFGTDDDRNTVFKVDLANPTVKLRDFEFETTTFGCKDPEDIAIDPATGNLFIIDESTAKIYEVTREGSLIGEVAMPTGVRSPEALAYDAQAQQFYVSGYRSADIFVLSRDGTLVDTIKDLREFRQPDGSRVVPKGLELAPSADGSGTTLWVADYGLDQTADGRLFAIDLGNPGELIV